MTVFCPHPTVTTPLPDVWWDAADPDKRTLNGSNFSALLDKSGNSVNATQTTAADQPPLNTDGQATGLDTMKGDGISDYMNIDVSLGSALTLALLADREVANNTAYIIGGDDPIGATPAFIQNFNPGTGVEAYEVLYVNSTTFRESLSQSATGFNICFVTHDDSFSTPKTRGYFNGAQVFTADFDSMSGNKLTELLTNFVKLDFSDCNFSAFGFWNSALPAYQVESLSKSYFLSNRGFK
jgi:hypothetical protein